MDDGRALEPNTRTHAHTLPQAAEAASRKVRGKDSRARRGALANQLCIKRASSYLALMHALKNRADRKQHIVKMT